MNEIRIVVCEKIGSLTQSRFEFSQNTDLSVKVVFPEGSGACSYDLNVLLNGQRLKFTLETGIPVVIPAAWLNNAGPGEMTFELQKFNKTRTVELDKGAYKIEPLTLTQTDTGGWNGTAVFAELKEQYEALGRALTAQKKSFEEELARLEEEAGKREERLKTERREEQIRFLSFAFNEYLSDLQLNASSLTLDEFATAFGIGNLTDGEREMITAKKEIF